MKSVSEILSEATAKWSAVSICLDSACTKAQTAANVIVAKSALVKSIVDNITDTSVIGQLIRANNKNPLIGGTIAGTRSLAVFSGGVLNTTTAGGGFGDVVARPNLATNASVWAHHEITFTTAWLIGFFEVRYGAFPAALHYVERASLSASNAKLTITPSPHVKIQRVNNKLWLSIELISSSGAGWTVDFFSPLPQYGLLRKGGIKTPIFTLTEDMS